MDHLGLTGQHTDAAIGPEIAELVALARHDNVSVKTTAPCYSTEPYPYPALHPFLRQLYDAFGPERLFWGLDLSRLRGSYPDLVRLFREELDFLLPPTSRRSWAAASWTWLTGDRKRRAAGFRTSACRNSTQLPSGSSTIATVTPGRATVGGRTTGRPAASQAQDLREVRHGDGPVPVAGRRADATGRRIRRRRRARPDQLDVAGPAHRRCMVPTIDSDSPMSVKPRVSR